MADPMFAVSIGHGSAMSEAVRWIAGLLTGSLGTTIAVLAIAGLGFSMLLGRLAMRDGAKVVLGCFILFGAPALAQALAGLTRGNEPPTSASIAVPVPKLDLPRAKPQSADPYAGASMPM